MRDHEGASIPIVEFRIRAMGEHINHVIMLRAEEIAERVRAAVTATVENFNFESYVRSETENFLRHYMTEGAGGDAIRELAEKLGEQGLNKILRK